MLNSSSCMTIFIYKSRPANRTYLIFWNEVSININITFIYSRLKLIKIKIIIFKISKKYDKISPSLVVFFLAIKL